jgi:3-phosphoshikimate 1-carboxyvinyltransferase
MAMALAVAGARIPNVVIRDPGCVAKTYPRFFDDFLAYLSGALG